MLFNFTSLRSLDVFYYHASRSQKGKMLRWNEHEGQQADLASQPQCSECSLQANKINNKPRDKMRSFYSVPANFFSVKWSRFFISTESEFPKIYQQLPKITEGFQQLPKISRRFLKITEDRASSDFQRISNQSRALLECRRCSDDFSNVKTQLNFYLIDF